LFRTNNPLWDYAQRIDKKVHGLREENCVSRKRVSIQIGSKQPFQNGPVRSPAEILYTNGIISNALFNGNLAGLSVYMEMSSSGNEVPRASNST
jgi:hypothetical protein